MVTTSRHRVGALVLAVATSATAVAPATPWANWETLSLEARPLPFFSGRVHMAVRDTGGKRLLETRTRARFLGVELASSRSVTTIDLTSGRTLEYVELSRKKGRRYTFDESGYAVERLRPTKGPDAPLDAWEVTSTERFSLPPSDETGATSPLLFDYYGLILHLKDAPLDRPGDTMTAWVATSHGPQAYRIRVADAGTRERTFDDLRTGETRTVAVREFRLRISPADPARADAGFMNMEGDTEILVEAGTRTLVEIDGRIPRVPGRVELTLKSIG